MRRIHLAAGGQHVRLVVELHQFLLRAETGGVNEDFGHQKG